MSKATETTQTAPAARTVESCVYAILDTGAGRREFSCRLAGMPYDAAAPVTVRTDPDVPAMTLAPGTDAHSAARILLSMVAVLAGTMPNEAAEDAA